MRGDEDMLDESVLAIWYYDFPGGNFMANMRRLEPGRLKVTYRFRYHRDDKAFDSADEKNWYEGIWRDVRDEALAVEAFGAACREAAPTKVYQIIRGNRTLDEFMDEFLAQPFINMRPATPEELDTMNRRQRREAAAKARRRRMH